MNNNKKFYQKNWFIYVCMFFFPPVGIALLWIFNKKSSTKFKGIISAIAVIWFVLLINSNPSNPTDTNTVVSNEYSPMLESTVSNESSLVTESTLVESEMQTESTNDTQVEEESTAPDTSSEVYTSEGKIEVSGTNEQRDFLFNENASPESNSEVSTDNSSGNTMQSSDQNTNTSNDTEISTATSNNFETYNNIEQQNTTAQYVLNTHTRRIHIPSCSSVATIKSENYATSNLSIAELEAQGYQRCGHCLK